MLDINKLMNNIENEEITYSDLKKNIDKSIKEKERKKFVNNNVILKKHYWIATNATIFNNNKILESIVKDFDI